MTQSAHLDHVEIVLDNQQRATAINELLERREQLRDIFKV